MGGARQSPLDAGPHDGKVACPDETFHQTNGISRWLQYNALGFLKVLKGGWILVVRWQCEEMSASQADGVETAGAP